MDILGNKLFLYLGGVLFILLFVGFLLILFLYNKKKTAILQGKNDKDNKSKKETAILQGEDDKDNQCWIDTNFNMKNFVGRNFTKNKSKNINIMNGDFTEEDESLISTMEFFNLCFIEFCNLVENKIYDISKDSFFKIKSSLESGNVENIIFSFDEVNKLEELDIYKGGIDRSGKNLFRILFVKIINKKTYLLYGKKEKKEYKENADFLKKMQMKINQNKNQNKDEYNGFSEEEKERYNFFLGLGDIEEELNKGINDNAKMFIFDYNKKEKIIKISIGIEHILCESVSERIQMLKNKYYPDSLEKVKIFLS